MKWKIKHVPNHQPVDDLLVLKPLVGNILIFTICVVSIKVPYREESKLRTFHVSKNMYELKLFSGIHKMMRKAINASPFIN